MTDSVSLDIENNVAIVTLNRADKYNALNIEVFESLVSIANKLKKNRSIRAVILRGEGKAFCSGLDVPAVMKAPTRIAKLLKKPDGRPDNLVQEIAITWREIPVPVIAVTHGVCYGGGFQLVLGADFRYSTPDCKFSILEGKWGLIPDMGITVLIRELVPIDVAKELTMTARIFEAPEALEMNLITRVCDDPLQEAKDFASSLSERSPDAVAATKELYNQAWLASEREALDWETRLQKKMLGRWNQIAASSRNFLKRPLPYIKRPRSLS